MGTRKVAAVAPVTGLGAVLPGGVVDRPAERRRAVRLLLRRGSRIVALSTELPGAGGFGKTTLARIISADRWVRRRFRGGVVELAVGRDATGAALAEKINDAVAAMTGVRPGHADARQAGQRLAALLRTGPRRLLVVDDVWTAEQVEPFTFDTGSSRILLVTREPSALPPGTPQVTVDRVTPAQARKMLSSEPLLADLERATGRWPLLIALINVAPRIPPTLDVRVAAQRDAALGAVIEELLGAHERRRFHELGIFAEGAWIPVSLVATLWARTGGLDAAATGELCTALARRSLLRRVADTVSLHDAIRAHLRSRLGLEGVRAANAELLDGLGNTAWTGGRYVWHHLPFHLEQAGRSGQRDRLVADLRWLCARLEGFGPAAVAADLAGSDDPRCRSLLRFVEQNAHLLAPTRPPHSQAAILLDRLAQQPDWWHRATVVAQERARPHLRSLWSPPAAFEPSLRRVLYLPGAVRLLAADPGGGWLATVEDGAGEVHLWDADGRHLRSLRGHRAPVSALVPTVDGRQLVTGGLDATVRFWDVATGRCRRTVRNHPGGVLGLAVAPDGSWFATVAANFRVYLWEGGGWQWRILDSHGARATAVATAPTGAWLATADDQGTLRFWSPRGDHVRGVRADRAEAIAIAPNGRWLAVAGRSGICLRDTATGRELRALPEPARAVAMAPGGAWFATAGYDGAVRLWDPSTGLELRALRGHSGPVNAVAVAGSGGWFATAGDDTTVRLWDAADVRAGDPRLPEPADPARLAARGHAGPVTALAFGPDDAWLATGAEDGTVRLWDTQTGRQLRALRMAGPVEAIEVSPDGRIRATAARGGEAAAPDGSWRATAGEDGAVHLWDASGAHRRVLVGHDGPVRSVAIAPDGAWLVSGGADRTVRIWDATSGECLAMTRVENEPTAVATGTAGPLVAVAAGTAPHLYRYVTQVT